MHRTANAQGPAPKKPDRKPTGQRNATAHRPSRLRHRQGALQKSQKHRICSECSTRGGTARPRKYDIAKWHGTIRLAQCNLVVMTLAGWRIKSRLAAPYCKYPFTIMVMEHARPTVIAVRQRLLKSKQKSKTSSFFRGHTVDKPSLPIVDKLFIQYFRHFFVITIPHTLSTRMSFCFT